MLLIGFLTVISALEAITNLSLTLADLWVLPLTFLGTFLGGLVAVFILVLIMAYTVNMEGPFDKDDKFYRFVTEQIIDAVIFLMRVRVTTSGLEKTVAASIGYPYIHYFFMDDAPAFINCYKETPQIQEALVEAIYGEIPFRGISPVDLNMD